MYISRLNIQQNTDSIEKYVEENGFATLICQGRDDLMSSHTPLIMKKTGHVAYLYGHVSIANEMAAAIKQGDSVLAVFMEKHSYISSSWYDHINVPTWNYIAVHIHGRFEMLNEEQTKESITELVNKYEKQSENPISVEKMGDVFFKKEVRGLIAFRIKIEKIDASWKLSQNRDDKNYAEIISKLRARGDAMSVAIAEEMEEIRIKE
jgi:transcriptional regulator